MMLLQTSIDKTLSLVVGLGIGLSSLPATATAAATQSPQQHSQEQHPQKNQQEYGPSPGPAPARDALTGDEPTVDDARAMAATRYTGFGMRDAGAFFATYGGTLTAMSQIYSNCGADDGICAPGVSLGLIVPGVAMSVIGLPLLYVGVKRTKQPGAWLAKKSRRRARMPKPTLSVLRRLRWLPRVAP